MNPLQRQASGSSDQTAWAADDLSIETDNGRFQRTLGTYHYDPLLTPQQVAERLNVSVDWVWDHSSRKTPLLPFIRFGVGPGRAGILRYRASKIEEFINEQERLSNSGRKSRRVQ